MDRYSYYPFKNPLDKLNGSDLKLLTGVAEGWYVDYKSEDLGARKNGQHLSSFANQYGGWLFFGIKEDGDTHTAKTFVGIDNSQLDSIRVSLREGSSAHVHPEVYYEDKVIYGPMPEIDLPEGRFILLVYVPKGLKTPYVHSSGRIYRRIADHSDPKPETDRFLLDALWKRSHEMREHWEEFLTKTPLLSSEQQGSTWIHIFIVPDVYKEDPHKILTYDDFLVLRSSSADLGPWAPMNRIVTTSDGYLAQQANDAGAELNPLSFRWWYKGDARFSIPLNTYDMARFRSLVGKYKSAEEYLAVIHKQNFRNIKIADFSKVLIALMALVNQYLTLRKLAGDTRTLYARMIIENSTMISPFLDEPGFIRRVNENGIPVVEDSNICMPQDASVERLIRLVPSDSLEIIQENPPCPVPPDLLLYSGVIGGMLLQAVGAITYQEQMFTDDFISSIWCSS